MWAGVVPRWSSRVFPRGRGVCSIVVGNGDRHCSGERETVGETFRHLRRGPQQMRNPSWRSCLLPRNSTRTSCSSTSSRSSGQSLFLKIEGMNFAGSVKLKAASEMVAAAERDGLLKPGSVLVESSSGNLGVALSMIAASKGYGFLCVTDSALQPADPAVDAGGGCAGAHRHRARPGQRSAGRPDELHRTVVRLRRAVRVAQPVRQPQRLDGALPHDRAGDRPRSSRIWTCCSSGPARPGR